MVQESEVRDKPTFLREHQGGSRAWGWVSERMRVEDEELSWHSWATGASLPHVQRARRVFQRHTVFLKRRGGFKHAWFLGNVVTKNAVTVLLTQLQQSPAPWSRRL